MLATVESFLLGFAAVFDTVLLLIMLERVNRPQVPAWLTCSFAAIWLLHVGDFLHSLLADSKGITAAHLDDWCMTMMAAGLLLLPAAVLHGGLRVLRTGKTPRPRPDPRYLAVYLPLLLLLPVSGSIFADPSRDFRMIVRPYILPYSLWLVMANCSAAVSFRLACRKLDRPTLIPFLNQFSALLLVMSAMVVAYLFVPTSSPSEPVLRMLIALSPVIPAFQFAWYAFRHRLMPLIFERTLVYGGCLVAVFWLHHVTIAPFTAALERQSQFDFFVIEVLLLVALILAWRPLRDRVSESLRYLLSSSVTSVRDATRELSVQLSQKSAESPESLARWLCESLRVSLNVESARIVIGSGLQIDVSSPDVPQLPWGKKSRTALCHKLNSMHFVTTEQVLDDEGLLKWMQSTRVSIVFRCVYRDIEGLVLIGPRDNSDRLSHEQRNTLALLFDQFAAVLFNQQREIIRPPLNARPCREKLSVLGLLAGSLAHEIRNPLSSMRTIATLLSEDLAGQPDQLKDVQLILTEIDRLTATTQRLLESARPADDIRRRAEPDVITQRLLRILGHLARQFGVRIETDFRAPNVAIAATESTLSEILFNLIRNALEAVQNCPAPQVTIQSETVGHEIVIRVIDNGPGITPELQNSLFQPFVTGKPQGTGLGLYIVSERIRELHGLIHCRSEAGSGTVFEVRLPVLRHDGPHPG